jgi:tetratricopeptide (TPR) repeat protein
MGVVYAARDPELDRTVALKLVSVPGTGTQAALAEAQALARLSHPNVVPVFDVGIDCDRVFIVMELIRGHTLRRWVEGRSVDETIAAYRQAGAALAAAHERGLVHRDFKPDNALVGTDGRVRVVDFGLACEVKDNAAASGLAVRGGGTPRYVAPEQATGQPARPAADQYSFAVALAEALRNRDGSTRAPKWVQALLERATAHDPAARFPSLPDLLRALGEDPVRRRRHRLGAVTIVAIAATAAYLLGRSTSPDDRLACTGGEEKLSSILKPAAFGGLEPLGTYARDLRPHLEAQLGQWTRRWVAGYRDACSAHRVGANSAALLDRRMVCLERGRSALQAVRDLLASAESKTLAQLPLAFGALPDPEACGDLEALSAKVEPPPPAMAARVAAIAAQIERARVEIAAGRLQSAREVAAAATAESRATGYEPVQAEALLAQGHALLLLDPRIDAVPPLLEATRLALEAGAHATAVEAWARRAWADGTSRADAAALAGLDVIEALAVRAPGGRFARALLHNNVGGVLLALAKPEQARQSFRRALADSSGLTGAGAVELINARVNLALTSPDPERGQLLAGAEQRLTALLGQGHPNAIEVRWIRGARALRLAEAESLLESTCGLYDRHDGLAGRAIKCWAELALVRRERDDSPGWRAALERGAAIIAPPSSLELAETKANLALARREIDRARALFETALQSRELAPQRPTEPYWVSLRRASLELGLGQALRAQGNLARAGATFDQAVGALAEVARVRGDDATILRRLGRARAELALTKAARGQHGPQIAALAADALTWLTLTGATREVASLVALTAH